MYNSQNLYKELVSISKELKRNNILSIDNILSRIHRHKIAINITLPIEILCHIWSFVAYKGENNLKQYKSNIKLLGEMMAFFGKDFFHEVKDLFINREKIKLLLRQKQSLMSTITKYENTKSIAVKIYNKSCDIPNILFVDKSDSSAIIERGFFDFVTNLKTITIHSQIRIKELNQMCPFENYETDYIQIGTKTFPMHFIEEKAREIIHPFA
jgi:hypothetical protein